MQWINSAGGPLMLLDESSLNNWGGVFDAIEGAPGDKTWSPDGMPTDYDRACRVDGYLGKIAVGTAEAIVLGDEPTATTWVESPEGGALVRWLYAENEAEALRGLKAIPDDSFHANGVFTVRNPSLLLFDSALAGRAAKKYSAEYLSIRLMCGEYDLATAVCRTDDLMLVVHRFRIKK